MARWKARCAFVCYLNEGLPNIGAMERIVSLSYENCWPTLGTVWHYVCEQLKPDDNTLMPAFHLHLGRKGTILMTHGSDDHAYTPIYKFGIVQDELAPMQSLHPQLNESTGPISQLVSMKLNIRVVAVEDVYRGIRSVVHLEESRNDKADDADGTYI